MRVLMFPSFTDNPYQPRLADALSALGVQVTLGTYEGPLSFARQIRATNPEVLHLHWTHVFLAPPKPSTLRALASALLFLRQCRALRRKGIPIVWTVHNLRNHERRHVEIERWGHRILARWVDRVIVHSESARTEVQQAFSLPAERIDVIPHGNYLGSYPQPPSREHARASLGIPADEKVFLCFGHIRPYKGVENLLDAFAAWPERKARLIVAGQPYSPELAEELRERAARDGRVQLKLKFVADSEMVELFAACDAAVLPYLATLTSGAAVLAASMARPFIAPALGAMRDFPPAACILYDPALASGLSTALEAAMRAPLDSMGQAAHRYVEGSPWSEVAQRTVQLYRRPNPPLREADGVTASAENPSRVR